MSVPPAGFGARWIDHRVPFQCSTSIPPLSIPRLLMLPTAMQLLFEVHDTPVRPMLPIRLGLGVGWIDHRLPFRCTTRLSDPTAVQVVCDAHDTLVSPVVERPVGVSCLAQLVPSQRTASGSCFGIPEHASQGRLSMAVQLFLAGHDTPVRR